MRKHGRSRHCATSPKVAGSIPDGVIGIFLFTETLRAQNSPGVYSNINKCQNYLLGGKGGRFVNMNLPLSYADFIEILAASNTWAPRNLYMDCFLFCRCI